MNDPVSLPLQALPDGEAELRLVLRLAWEDVAALGQEAGRLATQMQRPVTLDEAASHRLRTRSAAHAKPAPERSQPLIAPSTVSTLTARSPGEHARQAIEKINRTSGTDHGTAQSSA
ncbi:hypothetical protein NLX86_18350 [Streptomyces sp. A3M-1-3]|uniref:hypothetical protein n=1 Tax=Streptomyces sp. A3M-1-3 TaxID=2962044 RepID=UPI0020B769EA|nr:hypothetical protein [Streptomyces sp. A3M-1-3]MCP3819985.1 hypothetical protein [Streptomyces sp. A3M-1-3]